MSESEEREVERSKEQKEKVFRKSEKKIPVGRVPTSNVA